MKPSLKARWRLVIAGRARTLLLMVPLHMLAFVALYLAAARMMEDGFVETTTETSRLLLNQAVAQLAVASDDPADEEVRRRLLDLFLAAHSDLELALLDPRGRPVGPSPGDDPRAEESVRRILAGEMEEDFWLDSTGGMSRMRGFKRVVAADRCSSCHDLGETLGVAALSLNVTDSLRGVQDRVLRNLILLIIFWGAVFGVTTALVRRSVQRSASRLVADLTAAEAGERRATVDAKLVLDSGSAALHRSLREFLVRQREREAEVASKLERTDQLASLGGLAAGLAHEIKNPLAGIMGALEILREDTGEEFTRGLCDEMLAELVRVNETLQALLTSARPSPPQLTTIDLADLLAEVHRLIEPGLRRRSIQLEVETEGESLEARIDAAKIRQVLLNLIDNAAAAIDQGGTIHLRAADFPDGGGVIVAVEDDGPGIPEDTLRQIFDPFYTTKFAGTGLGLAISQSLVEQHGGTLQVESEVGKGTTFFVFLPEGGPDDDTCDTALPREDA